MSPTWKTVFEILHKLSV